MSWADAPHRDELPPRGEWVIRCPRCGGPRRVFPHWCHRMRCSGGRCNAYESECRVCLAARAYSVPLPAPFDGLCMCLACLNSSDTSPWERALARR